MNEASNESKKINVILKHYYKKKKSFTFDRIFEHLLENLFKLNTYINLLSYSRYKKIKQNLI